MAVTPVLLAAVAVLRHSLHRARCREGRADKDQHYRSELLQGRVSHTRLRPKRHAFGYPMLMVALDLAEMPQLLDRLWPLLPVCVQWSEEDHLKNGEGRLGSGGGGGGEDAHGPRVTDTAPNHEPNNHMPQNEDDNDESVPSTHTEQLSNSLLARIFRLVAQRTDYNFAPNQHTHRVVLLTNFSYFGYCFNPVSFYLIIHKEKSTLDAVVGEVSNTPWLEMQCYVLHPDSMDRVQVLSSTTGECAASKRYIFPKTFHVSPFMEMDYWYDWTFELPHAPSQSQHRSNDASLADIRITTAMRVMTPEHVAQGSRPVDGKGMRSTGSHSTFDAAAVAMAPLQFTATLRLTESSSFWEPPHLLLTAAAPALVRWPAFGVLTQVWIHYQAALLYFWKQVPFIPHPSSHEETAPNWATRTIASIVSLLDAAAHLGRSAAVGRTSLP